MLIKEFDFLGNVEYHTVALLYSDMNNKELTKKEIKH